MNTLSYSNYREEVETLANDIFNDVVDYQRPLSDALHEAIDGHEWVIYTYYHKQILEHIIKFISEILESKKAKQEIERQDIIILADQILK